MLIEAKQSKLVEVEVDPCVILNDLRSMWLNNILIPYNAKLNEVEQWYSPVSKEVYRYATEEEVHQHFAFDVLTKLVKDL